MRILLTGATGQLGREICRSRLPPETSLIAASRSRLDLTRPSEIASFVQQIRPDLIINAAAYTSVDRAESEPSLAFAINCDGAETLAKAAAAQQIPIVQFSTDYVFDGCKESGWSEEDYPHPLNVYGESKLAGEIAVSTANRRHLILRVSWLYSAQGSNFLLSMLRLGRERDHLSIIDDQIGRPTSATDLADAAIGMILKAMSDDRCWGLYHFSNSGPPVSWYGFADEIFRQAERRMGRRPDLERISTEEFNAPAVRPKNSVFNLGKIGRVFGIEPQPWQSALAAVLREVQGQDIESKE